MGSPWASSSRSKSRSSSRRYASRSPAFVRSGSSMSLVRDEAERPVGGPADDAVSAGEGAVCGCVQRALVRADRVYFVGDDAAGELVVEVEQTERSVSFP